MYWSNNAEKLLAGLNDNQDLAEQLSPAAFSFQRAPIWQDSSTTVDCKRLENEIGGAYVLAERTGSRAYERFTGNQIARVSMNRYISVDIPQLVGICPTDTSVATRGI